MKQQTGCVLSCNAARTSPAFMDRCITMLRRGQPDHDRVYKFTSRILRRCCKHAPTGFCGTTHEHKEDRGEQYQRKLHNFTVAQILIENSDSHCGKKTTSATNKYSSILISAYKIQVGFMSHTHDISSFH